MSPLVLILTTVFLLAAAINVQKVKSKTGKNGVGSPSTGDQKQYKRFVRSALRRRSAGLRNRRRRDPELEMDDEYENEDDGDGVFYDPVPRAYYGTLMDDMERCERIRRSETPDHIYSAIEGSLGGDSLYHYTAANYMSRHYRDCFMFSTNIDKRFCGHTDVICGIGSGRVDYRDIPRYEYRRVLRMLVRQIRNPSYYPVYVISGVRVSLRTRASRYELNMISYGGEGKICHAYISSTGLQFLGCAG